MASLEHWADFNVAMAGATAALAGLVIVAASVNITEIVKQTSITSRLASAIAGLVLAIAGSAVGLIPELSAISYGITVIVFALIGAGFAVEATRRIFENRDPQNKLRPLKALLGFAVPVTYVVGGILLLAGSATGLVWVAAGSIAAIAAALMVSWVVLVEVLR